VGILNSILKTGVRHTNDSLGMRRVVFFNYLLVFCIVVTVFLSLLSSSFNFTSMAIMCFLGTLLYGISLIFNRQGYFEVSKYIFLVSSLALISIGTYINVNETLLVEAENMLIVVMAVCMFIFDGKRKHIVYWLVFGSFIFIKHQILIQSQNPEPLNYILGIANNVIVGLILYGFLTACRSILIGALDKNERQEERLYSLVDNVPVFLAMVDVDGNYTLANENYASNFRIDRREIIGKNRREVLPKKLIRNQQKYFERARKGEAVSFMREIHLPSGVSISARGKYEPIVDETGKVEAITICVDDVTSLIKTQEALKEANETKDKLFSIIAHDIKSPLNMFETFLNMSEESKMSAEDFFGYQKMLRERLGSLTGTVNELLEWSRMQLGGISAYPEMVNISAIVKDNQDLFDSLIKKKSIQFEVHTPQGVVAWVDENHFKVVLRNLIHNAIKFTGGGGKIEVTAEQVDGETLVSVADTGVGMSSDQVDSIIKKEIQDSQAGTAKELGTGLGLSLSLGLLEKNNCRISVNSELNKGTTFEIGIPVKKEEEVIS